MKKIVLQILYSVFGRLFLKLIVGVKFSDNQFLKNEEQFIIVANHNSHLDTFTILSSLPKSIIDKVKPIAAKDYFGKTKLTAKISNYFLNTLLISRNKDDKEYKNPIEEMLKAIDNGNSLVLFPEGTRGEAEKMEDIKKGIAILLFLLCKEAIILLNTLIGLATAPP